MAGVLLLGSLFPTSMRINKQGRLVVNFRTKAHFRGLFVQSHSPGRIKRSGKGDRCLILFCSIPKEFNKKNIFYFNFNITS